MPPVRKKGGTINNNNNNNFNDSNIINNNNNRSKLQGVSELKLGDLVLAKVKGFPAWPATVSRPEDWGRTPDPKKYFVEFFGTKEIGFVTPADVQAFTSESKGKLFAKCKGKTVKYFIQAVKEICGVFEELQKQGDLGRDTFNVDHEIVNGSHVERSKDLKSGESGKKNSATDSANLFCDSAVEDKQTAAMKDPVVHRQKKIKMKKESDSVSPGPAQGLFTTPASVQEKSLDEKKDVSAYDEHIESSRALSSSPYDGDFVVERKPSYHSTGKKDSLMPSAASGHPHFSAGEDKKSSIRDKSKEVKVGAKRKVDDVICQANDAKASVASNLNKLELRAQGNASKNLFKGPKLPDISKSSPKSSVYKAERHLDGGRPRHKNDQAGNGKPLSVKKDKVVDRMSDSTKGSVPNNGNCDLKPEWLAEEAVSPVPKPSHHAPVVVSNEGKRSLGSSSVKNDVPKKRRAVRLCDDDNDDEPKTPVHGGSLKSGVKVSSSVLISDSLKTNEKNDSSSCSEQIVIAANQDGGTSQKNHYPIPKSTGVSPVDAMHLQKADSSTQANVSHSPGFDKVVVKESRTDLLSPIKSPQAVATVKRSAGLDKGVGKGSKTDLLSPVKSPQVVTNVKKSLDQQWPNKPSSRVPDSVPYFKAQSKSGKDQTSNSSHSRVSSQKSRQPISGDVTKISPKPGVVFIEPAASLDNHKDHEPGFGRRLEDARVKSVSVGDSKASDTSIKNLIAQAKRRQAHKQAVPPGSEDSVMVPNANLLLKNSSPSSTSPTFQPNEVNVTQGGAEGIEPRRSLSSPFRFAAQSGFEDSEEKGPSLGLHSAGSTLSGNTEAAVVRDAFEGMIETLSRTKESIGRATRLAIDCAKHGIANEVVDLLIHKLENESSFHRRVDLFFLVDSITQCSHSQKGVAGASYLPTVQAALPRLLRAAAPPGPSARENRRQCLKVMRLWLERKILPDKVIRRFMDDIGGSNDETSNVPNFKRPSKANRSVDDPIREMEGMLVDEYGSNATFNLPGFLSTHGFVDDEEDEDDVPNISHGVPNISHSESVPSPVQQCTNASIEPDAERDTPSDRSHHILEDVDGELEMEDVSGHPKEGALFLSNLTKNDEQELPLETEVDTSTDNIADNIAEPQHLEGSPPLPFESPPPLPPLPTSPPPPPPPPQSPLPPPPPPPPPPSTVLSQPPFPSLLPSGPPHSGNLQHFVPVQLSMTPQVGGHTVQMAGNTPQPAPSFVPAGVAITRPIEYGKVDVYPGPLAGPSNQQFQQLQQFQPSPAAFVQRPFTPASVPQPPLGPYAYNNPPPQQHIQHPRPHLPTFPPPPSHSYPLSNSEGLRRFSDGQWRPAHGDYKADSHHNAWVNAGRAQQGSTTTFSGEVFFRPPERAPTDNLGHHASAPNSSMGVPSSSGHGINQMLPFRPDMSSVNHWRPL